MSEAASAIHHGRDSETATTSFRSAIVDPLKLLSISYEKGQRCCLVTIVGIEGTSPRKLGAQLAVTEHGEVAGSISGGCLDSSVITEAQRCLQLGISQRLRYGAGSPYIDLTLPCGSGLDLQFDGAIEAGTVTSIAQRLTRREVIDLRWRADTATPSLSNAETGSTAEAAGAVSVRIAPRLRVVVAGNGENLWAFCRIARASHIDVLALHPDPTLDDSLRQLGVQTRVLQSAHLLPALDWDEFTAGLTLFHDHHWELPFLLQALSSKAMMVGAMGSQRASTQRIENLRLQGADDAAIARLRGPIGLLPRARDPEELAVSVLGELMQCYRQQCQAFGVSA